MSRHSGIFMGAGRKYGVRARDESTYKKGKLVHHEKSAPRQKATNGMVRSKHHPRKSGTIRLHRGCYIWGDRVEWRQMGAVDRRGKGVSRSGGGAYGRSRAPVLTVTVACPEWGAPGQGNMAAKARYVPVRPCWMCGMTTWRSGGPDRFSLEPVSSCRLCERAPSWMT